jgi:hypothetical protein
LGFSIPDEVDAFGGDELELEPDMEFGFATFDFGVFDLPADEDVDGLRGFASSRGSKLLRVFPILELVCAF